MRIMFDNNTRSIEFDGTEFWLAGHSIHYRLGNSTGVLGRYETPERAFQIFWDMHCEWEKSPLSTFCMPEV